MKKLLQLLFISSILLSFISCVYEPKVYNFPNRIVDPTIDNVDKKETPTNKKHVDTLLVCYMDGDNDLEKDIKADLREAREGYALIKNTDDVEVLVLWDGLGKGDSCLYRIARNNRLEDISEGISWMRYTDNDGQIYYEVNMNDYKTLANYLTWVKDHYSYNNIILQMSDHGVGPGTHFPPIERAVCQDWNTTNGTGRFDLLGTEDIPKAIKESGINKIDLVIEDVCLGGTIEEVYAFRDVADYMLLSPNLVPKTGMDYTFLVSSLSTGQFVIDRKLQTEKYLDAIVCHYMKDSYAAISPAYVNELKKEISKQYENNNQTITEEELNLQVSYKLLYSTNAIVKTLSGFKLKDIENVKVAVDNFVDSFPSINASNAITNFIDNAVNPNRKYYEQMFNIFNGSNKYSSNVSYLYDIGMLCDDVINKFDVTDLDQNIVNNIKNTAQKLKESLNNVVVCSWRDGVNGALYNKTSNKNISSHPAFENGSYGLLICGPSNYRKVKPEVGMNPYYEEDLSFGRDSKWNDFCKKVCNTEHGKIIKL